MSGLRTSCLNVRKTHHVTDCAHSSGRDAVNAISKVFHDTHGASLHSQDPSNLQDDILGTGPARQLPGQLHTNHPGALQLPRDVGHHIDCVGTTHTNAEATEATTVGGVRVCANHKEARESIVLEDDLVDDAAACGLTMDRQKM